MVTEDPRQRTAGAALRRAILLAAALALPVAALPARAQTATPAASPPSRTRPRIALVLSGGSAKGLAHIGVLRVLQEAGVPIDLVTGTSMGALVGGLYAIGYSPADLARLGTTLDWTALFQDTFDARQMPMAQMDVVARPLITLPVTNGKVGLPQSLIAGQRIAELLDRLTWPAQTVRDFHQLPIPFEAVATDIATGKPVVLDHGSLAGALEASMAIPTIFRPVEVGGRTLIDGGWSQNLPAEEARAMGADVVICSDVSDQLLSAGEIHDLVDVLMQTVTFQINASRPEQRRHCDIYVRPDPNGMSAFSFNHASTWIARGDSAARAVWPALRQLAAGAAAAAPAAAPVSLNADAPAPVHVGAVRVEAPSPAAERAVRRLLRLGPGRVTPGRLERAVERVYASGMYGRVWYQLQAAGTDTAVVVHAEPREANRVGFGFRYDERYDASLLFTATLRSLLGYGSETRVEARLGEQLQFGVRTVRRGVLSSPLTVGGSASYTRSPFDRFLDGHRVASADMVVNAASLTVGLELLGDAGIAAQAAAERVGGQRIFASADSTGPRERTVASLSALAWWSALDREEFPRQGVDLFARAEGAFGGGAPFTHAVADVRAAVPLSRRLTLQARATAGATIGTGDIPVTYRFFLGGSTASGAFPETQLAFLGLQPQERMGTAVSRMEGALQWEPVPNVFASVAADAGDVALTLRHTLDRPIVGAGVSIGSQTILGPINLTISGRSLGEWPRVGVNIGYIF